MRDEAEAEALKRNPIYPEAREYVNAFKKDIIDEINKHRTFDSRTN